MADRKYKILIVDDDEFFLDIYTKKFSHESHEIKSAKSGEEALATLEQDPNFDILLLDINMSSMNGFTVLEKIREKKLLENAAIIILSNQGQESDIERAKSYNVDGYIVKANTIPSEVLAEVTSIAEKKAGKSA